MCVIPSPERVCASHIVGCRRMDWQEEATQALWSASLVLDDWAMGGGGTCLDLHDRTILEEVLDIGVGVLPPLQSSWMLVVRESGSLCKLSAGSRGGGGSWREGTLTGSR